MRIFFFVCAMCIGAECCGNGERGRLLVVRLFLVVVMMDYSVIYFVDVASYVDRGYACAAPPHPRDAVPSTHRHLFDSKTLVVGWVTR